MHDLRVFRERAEELRDGMRRRGTLDALEPVIARGEALDRERRAMLQAVEERKAERNALSQDVARRKKAKENADEPMARSRALGEEISRLESEFASVEAEMTRILFEIPNITLGDVPAGGEEHNVIVRAWGTPRVETGLRPHWELGESSGMLDLLRGAKISGSGFIVFRSQGARLVRSLLNLMLDLHTTRHGYEEAWVPSVVNRATMTATGQLPKFEEDMYGLRDEGMFLIPTAEVPVTNLFRDEVLAESQLPHGFVAYTPCFRREAGAHGKDTRGLLRVHQFDKVELVRFTTPETSTSDLELLLSHAEAVLVALDIPYRVKLLAAGDTGFSNAKTYDLEVWAPGVGQWLEVSSCSSYTDYQARRGNIRYKPADGGKPRFVHTLNGSALALPRTIAALLEHGQRPDGSVALPSALQTYFGADALR